MVESPLVIAQAAVHVLKKWSKEKVNLRTEEEHVRMVEEEYQETNDLLENDAYPILGDSKC